MTENHFPDTLTEALQQAAKGDKSITYISSKTQETTVSYQELLSRALRLLYQFRKAGLQAGNELILLTESNEHFLDAFWAALLGGIIPVPLSATSNNSAQKRVLAVFQKLHKPFLWTSEKALSGLSDYAENHDLAEFFPTVRKNTLLIEQITPDANQANPAAIKAQDIAFIQFSSGSTGTPKGVLLTHNNLLSNIRSIITGSQATQNDIVLSWMPLTHDMGIIGFHLTPLLLNANVYLIPPELFVRRPLLWLEKISDKKATVSSSPNFGYQHVLKYFDPAKHNGLDLSSLRLIFNGAEPISAEICRQFNQTFNPFGLTEQAIFPVYGLAEASLAATFSKPTDPVASINVKRDQLHIGEEVQILPASAKDALEIVLLGGPVPDTEVRIINPEGNVLSENQLGHVLIRGDNVTSGYYDDTSLTGETITEDGWLNTGDIGFLHNGQLLITGRHKDLIIINGQNYHPHDIEKLCETLTAVEAEKTAACSVPGEAGEQLAVFIINRGGLEEFSHVIAEVRKILSQEAGIDAAQIIPVPSFPKTTSGKVQRFLLAEQYAAGSFDQTIKQLQNTAASAAASTTVASATQQTLLEICNTIISDKKIGVDDNLFEIGTSSLNLTQIHERIDELFPEQVELTDLFDYPTISELAAFLDKATTA